METKKCIKCNIEKTLDNFTFRKDTGKYRGVCHECRRKDYKENSKTRELSIKRAKDYYEKNKEKVLINRKKRYREDLRKVMYKSAKDRAKRDGLPFDIEIEDIVIPEKCPVFGIKLEVGDNYNKMNSPSLDKIIPEKGYVKGNIIVVSVKANTMKSNATIEEMKRLYEFYDNLIRDKEKNRNE